MKIAITGGIGSGKSFVCKRLEARGITVYDCDRAAKRLMRTDEKLKRKLQLLVGRDLYRDGQLQKPLMAKFLMESEENMLAVNALVHPAVANDFLQSGMTWLESAILFESGFHLMVPFSCVVCVVAPETVRLERIMQRDGISREQAMQWISKQWPQDKVMQQSDFVILNDGEADVDQQLDQMLETMAERHEFILNKDDFNKLNQ